jgi:hypothetical protein
MAKWFHFKSVGAVIQKAYQQPNGYFFALP